MTERALYAILSADAGVSARVGNRIVPVKDEDGAGLAVPYVIYDRIGSDPIFSLSGRCAVDVRIRLSVYAGDYDTMLDAAQAVRAAIDGYSGTVSGVSVLWAAVESEFDLESDAAAGFARVLDVVLTTDEGAS